MVDVLKQFFFNHWMAKYLDLLIKVEATLLSNAYLTRMMTTIANNTYIFVLKSTNK